VTLYADDTKTTPVLGFKARQVLDLDRRLVTAMAVALDGLQSG
jgi:hypothetical protein